jgi:membrane protein
VPAFPRHSLLYFLRLLGTTIRCFFAEKTPRHGAALAFYTTIAIAPLLVLTISLAGIFLEDQAARQQLLAEIEQLAGPQVSEALREFESPAQQTYGNVASFLGAGMLVFGATGVLRHLSISLRIVWGDDDAGDQGIWRTFLQELFSFAVVLAIGFLLLVSLVVSAILSWAGQEALVGAGLEETFLEITNAIISFFVITFLFSVVFRYLPPRGLKWSDVMWGSLFTSFLFVIGKSILGWYLGRAAATSAYGAASSVLVLLLWSYYASQIVLLGAIFTREFTKEEEQSGN